MTLLNTYIAGRLLIACFRKSIIEGNHENHFTCIIYFMGSAVNVIPQ